MSSSNRQIASDDEDDGQMQKQRKGRAVIQSDDDEAENQNPTTPRRSSSKKTSKKQRHTANSDGEMHVDDNQEEPATPAPASILSSNRSKKRRVVRADDDDENDENEDPLNSEKKPDLKPKPKKGLVRDPKDRFVMGSIVRITCHDFLTYNDIECTPGAHLNIIFGPNGSGKSSLAGAIAIGLGFSTKVVGRQSDLAGYVRRGCKEGWVEIELKGKPGKPNRVVRRELTAANNSSTFYLDGQKCTKTEVSDAVLELHVNVDNLCSFLPQDRVAAFAAMSGPEILKETQRVVNPKLIEEQEQLADYKQQLDKATSAFEKNEASLGEKERRVASMEKDVRRHKQKKKIEDDVEILQRLHPYAEYRELKEKVDGLKKLRNQAKERVDELKDENAPMVERRDALQARALAADARKKSITEERNKREREHTNLIKKLQASDNELEKLREEANQLKVQEEQRQNEIRGATKEIERLQKLLNTEEGPPNPDEPELVQRYTEATARLREVTAKVTEIVHKNQDFDNESNRILAEKRRLQTLLAGLDDVAKRREAACARSDQSLWTVTQWVREHRADFQDKVYDPIRLEINVKDKRHAKVAEAAINYGAMKTIICLNPDDYKKLSDTFTRFPTGQGNWRDMRMNVAELPADKRTLAAYPKPMSPQELNQWGFDCFAIDLIEGPEHVLAYLCEAQNLHQVPVALDDGQRIRQEALVRPNTPFRKFISRQHVTSITVSRYGQNKCIAQDQQTKDPSIFVETVDNNRKRELELAMADVEAQKTALQAQRDAIIAQDAALRLEHGTLHTDQKAIKEERDQRRNAQLAWEKNKVTLRNAQHRLQVLKGKPSEEAAKQRIAGKMKKLTSDRLKQAGKLGILLRAIVEAHNAETLIVFAGIQANMNFRRADAEVNNANAELQEATAVFKQAKEEYGQVFASAKETYNRATEGQRSLPERLGPDFDVQFEQLNDTSSEAIQAEVQAKQAELQMIANVSPTIVEKYETLSAEAESLRKELGNQEATVTRTKNQIEKIRGKWYPEVQRIAQIVGGRFAKNMEDMGCLGEVDIAEHEDYAKWAVNIKVAFRDKEAVQSLSSQRQSGGEKSLSTMLYLISLLELSKVPFSLVDEINQGMDQRAERAVHNQLVHAVCERDDVGQYFLITPKLLTNLNYHEKIKILCVNNGDWLPEELPLRKLIGRRLKAKQQNRK